MPVLLVFVFDIQANNSSAKAHLNLSSGTYMLTFFLEIIPIGSLNLIGGLQDYILKVINPILEFQEL